MTDLKYKSVACFFWGGQMYGFHPALKRLCNQRLFAWPRLKAQTWRGLMLFLVKKKLAKNLEKANCYGKKHQIE